MEVICGGRASPSVSISVSVSVLDVGGWRELGVEEIKSRGIEEMLDEEEEEEEGACCINNLRVFSLPARRLLNSARLNGISSSSFELVLEEEGGREELFRTGRTSGTSMSGSISMSFVDA